MYLTFIASRIPIIGARSELIANRHHEKRCRFDCSEGRWSRQELGEGVVVLEVSEEMELER